MDYEEMKNKVDEFLAGINVTYSVVNRGADKDDTGWEHDRWEVTLKRVAGGASSKTVAAMTTTFRTGTGHRILPRADTFYSFKKDKDGKLVSAPRSPDRFVARQQEVRAKPVPPRAADVLYSLVLDGNAAHMSFHDWASDYGMDTDSLKALDTYNKCGEIGREMRKMFNHTERAALEELVREL